MGSLVKGNPDKFIVDSIHGDIHFTDTEWKVLDTPPFQRLRRIKQLQLGQLTYPNATHTRFAHSLGTLALMDKILRVAHDKLKLSKTQQENLRLAALLHDVGHYPYSHLMEGVDYVELTDDIIKLSGDTKEANLQKDKYIKHEDFGKLIVTSQKTLITAIGSRKKAKEVSDLFSKDKSADVKLTKLLSSSFDLDRLDYLIRDSHAAGVPYGHIDINYLLNSLDISSDGTLGIKEKALPAVEHFLLARFFMHRAVYFHKTTYGIEEALRHLLKRVKNKCEISLIDKNHYLGFPVKSEEIKKIASNVELYEFDDSYIDRIVQKATKDQDFVISLLGKTVQSRTPPKLLKEVLIFDELGQKHDDGKAFRRNLRDKLSIMLDKYSLISGQFLWCAPKPIVLEKGEDKRSASEYKSMTLEQRENTLREEKDIIQILEKKSNTSKSILNFKHSIISKFENMAFQIFRLYFIPQMDMDEKAKSTLVENLRKDVSDWDKL